jgi:cytochrome oxidase Cu insertion factor (SCO1/SenC/PrrC family)
MKSHRLLGITATILLVASSVAGQERRVTGPKDGAGLPPTDLERVRVGSVAPDFTLESKDGELVTLSSFRGRQNVVLVFYRGHW